jgi:hypothetical protein
VVYFVVVMKPELGFCIIFVVTLVVAELVLAALTSRLEEVMLLQSAHKYEDELLIVVVVVVLLVSAALTGIDEDMLLVQSAHTYALVVVLLEVVVATLTGVEPDGLPIQSAQVEELGPIVELDEAAATSTGATGAVGQEGWLSFGVAETVTVLCTTSVTVTYETEHGAPPLPVCTGIRVIVSVVVDCRVMVVVASSVLAAATLLTLFGPWGGPPAGGEGRVMVA